MEIVSNRPGHIAMSTVNMIRWVRFMTQLRMAANPMNEPSVNAHFYAQTLSLHVLSLSEDAVRTGF